MINPPKRMLCVYIYIHSEYVYVYVQCMYIIVYIIIYYYILLYHVYTITHYDITMLISMGNLFWSYPYCPY